MKTWTDCSYPGQAVSALACARQSRVIYEMEMSGCLLG